MEKKPIKYIQTENPKSSKKFKELKLLTNYIPIKKANGQSNISEYETESSIQKNFSNKCHKNKNHIQAKSVQATDNNHISPKKSKEKRKKEKIHQRYNRSSRGSLYNLNNLNLGEYFNEKIIITRQKFFDYKDNKINTLKNELSLLKKELIFYENKNNNIINDKMIKQNNIQINKSHSVDKNKNNNQNNLEIKPFYGNNDKVMLENNSFASFNIFHRNEILCNNVDNADKKLKKHLSSLLNDNNNANININNNIKTNMSNNINNGIKNRNKNKKNKKNINKDMNKKNLLNVIYLSKKGCYNHTNNNYDHNAKVVNTNNNYKYDNEKKGIKHDLHFYANTMKEKQNELRENLKNKKGNNILQQELQNLSDKMNNLFHSFFDYYENNNSKLK